MPSDRSDIARSSGVGNLATPRTAQDACFRREHRSTRPRRRPRSLASGVTGGGETTAINPSRRRARSPGSRLACALPFANRSRVAGRSRRCCAPRVSRWRSREAVRLGGGRVGAGTRHPGARPSQESARGRRPSPARHAARGRRHGACAAAALVATFVTLLIDSLLSSHRRHQPPKVAAADQLREPASGRATPKTVEGAQGDVLLIAGRTRGAAKPGTGQTNEAV